MRGHRQRIPIWLSFSALSFFYRYACALRLFGDGIVHGGGLACRRFGLWIFLITRRTSGRSINLVATLAKLLPPLGAFIVLAIADVQTGYHALDFTGVESSVFPRMNRSEHLPCLLRCGCLWR